MHARNANQLAAKPLNFIERLFLKVAQKSLPLKSAEIARSRWGYLTFQWNAPCAELGSLWISISPNEIFLSDKISHSHFPRKDFKDSPKTDRTNRKMKKKIIYDSIRMAAEFLSGDISVTIAYTPEGKLHSIGTVKTSELAESLLNYRNIFGEKFTRRAWNWFGEVRY